MGGLGGVERSAQEKGSKEPIKSLRENFIAGSSHVRMTKSVNQPDSGKNDAHLRRERVGSIWAAVISAFVFAVFHMSLVKLPATFLLGFGFAFIVWKGGSIYVTMALHFFNNALSAIILKYPRQAGKLFPILLKTEFTSVELAGLFAGGLALMAIGVWLLDRTATKNRKEKETRK